MKRVAKAARKGFSLVEVLVAVAILTFTIVGLFTLLSLSSKSLLNADLRETGKDLATAQMEYIKHLNYQSFTGTTLTADTAVDATSLPVGDTTQFPSSGWLSVLTVPTTILNGNVPIGSTTLAVANAAEFPTIGSILVGGASDAESLTYSARTDGAVTLASPATLAHFSGDPVALKYPVTETLNYGGKTATSFALINPTTKIHRTGDPVTSVLYLTSPVGVGANTLQVSSTAGFPSSGKVILGTGSTAEILSYSSRTASTVRLSSVTAMAHPEGDLLCAAVLGTSLSGATGVGAATLSVASTAAFPEAGAVTLGSGAGAETLAYSSKTPGGLSLSVPASKAHAAGDPVSFTYPKNPALDLSGYDLVVGLENVQGDGNLQRITITVRKIVQTLVTPIASKEEVTTFVDYKANK